MNLLFVNPKFPPSFFNFAASGARTPFKACAPPLGLITAAALIPESATARLVDENVRPLERRDFDWADAVFVGAMLPQRAHALDVLARAKAAGKPTVFGGPYATFHAAELFAAGCDVVVQGEAEHLMGRVFEALDAGASGVAVKAESMPDMAQSPMPRWDLVNPADYGSMVVQTTRGCPHGCEFCQVVELNGRIPRHKPVERVLAELDRLFELGARDTVLICDDNFIGDPAYAKDLLERLGPWSKSRGEPFSFSVQASINLAGRDDLIDLMTEANVVDVFIGVETPDPESLEKARKYTNLRRPLLEALKHVNRRGLSIQASFIIGFDGEAAGAGERIVQFAEEANLATVMLNTLYALPGSALWRRLSAEGRVGGEVIGFGPVGVDSNIAYTRPKEEVRLEFVDALAKLYDEEAYIRRSLRMILERRPTRAALAQAGGPAYQDVKPAGRSLTAKRRRFGMALNFFLRLGLASPRRGLFWQSLLAVRRKNPSRLTDFLALLITCDFYAHFARTIRQSPRAPQGGGVSG